MTEFAERYRWLIIGAFAVPLLVALGFLLRERTDDPEPLQVNLAPAEIRVYIIGAVKHSGVYPAEEGDRWIDVLEAAGGPTADADLARVNLARRVHDEDAHRRLPHRGRALRQHRGAGDPRHHPPVRIRRDQGPDHRGPMILGYLALAWLLGIAAAAYSGADPWAAVAAAGLLGLVTVALRPRTGTVALAVLGALLVFTAAWRYDSSLPAGPPAVARYNDGGVVRFRALVTGEPDERASSVRYRLSVRELRGKHGWRPSDGGILMTASAFPRYEYGDILEVKGDLQTPPTFGDFDYRGYLERRGIVSLIQYPKVELLERGQGNAFRAGLIDARGRLSDALSDALPEPEASLAAGVLLGRRATLSNDLTGAMNVTGTSHLVAVSGQNVTLLAGLLIGALAWAIGRRPAAWLALAAVVGYSFLVGGEPSVIRAAIMAGLYIMASTTGRQNSAFQALALAGAAMTALDPRVVNDVSFQLSFAATLGLMVFAPVLRTYGETWADGRPALADFPLTRPAIELAAVTAAAIAFTLPITAINFERVSLIAPLANLLAVPAFVLVAATAAVTAGLGAAVPPLAPYLGWIAWPPAAYMSSVVRLLADVPLASVTLNDVGLGHAVGYYAALLAMVWLLAAHRPEPKPVVRRPAAAPRSAALPATGLVLLLALASVTLWLYAAAPSAGRLSVSFLDVGQGDAILIRGPQGHKVLVDGGPGGEAVTSALGRHLPFWDRRLDLVVLTHPQADHVTGLVAVLERYDVEAIIAAPLTADSAAYRAWTEAAREEGVPVGAATAGVTVPLGDGAYITVLHPPPGLLPFDRDDLNENSLVLRVAMDGVSILLTADIGRDGELALIEEASGLRATVLQVPHHGSRFSASPEFLREVGPAVAVVSVGEGNRFGPPAPETLERLAGTPVFRTDEDGDVTVWTDGERLWVKTQR
ncbi:MAG: DNA internalization-related competence protein ComEC/Rec2 [Chloroflexi bacterium]|nr:DNA internalization-related competence protein ComEC/Rec2 [Chloroflexota bacterium]